MGSKTDLEAPPPQPIDSSSQALSRSQERLQLAMDALGFGIWDWDVPTGRVDWDNGMYQVFGVPQSQFAGDFASFASLLNPDDAQRVGQELSLVFSRRERQFQIEFRTAASGGKEKFIRGSGLVVYNENGQPIRAVGANWDVTEERAAQKALTDTARMASLGQMAGGVAHEINNPLAVIHGKADQLLRAVKEGPNPDPRLQNGLEKILTTCNRIAKIVKGLRAFARDNQDDPLEMASLREILEDTLDLCTERMRNNGVELRLDSIPDVELPCRPLQLGQVLLNLLNNAYDAIQNHPEKWIQISTALHRDTLEIHVTDSGPGISGDVARRMMEPFFTTKKVGQGTGLGLSISRGIVEAHGGTLRLDPRHPHTRFVMELPRHLSKSAAA